MKQTLLAGLPALNLQLNVGQIDTFCRFGEMLLEKNKVMNLTAITDPDKIILNHYADCATLASRLKKGASVIDVGCGAGFPTLPLAIFSII